MYLNIKFTCVKVTSPVSTSLSARMSGNPVCKVQVCITSLTDTPLGSKSSFPVSLIIASSCSKRSSWMAVPNALKI